MDLDPNTALVELRLALRAVREYQDNDTGAPGYCEVPNRVIDRVVDHFTALDEWLSKGGFLPDSTAPEHREKRS
jgi:hypothetical protein